MHSEISYFETTVTTQMAHVGDIKVHFFGARVTCNANAFEREAVTKSAQNKFYVT